MGQPSFHQDRQAPFHPNWVRGVRVQAAFSSLRHQVLSDCPPQLYQVGSLHLHNPFWLSYSPHDALFKQIPESTSIITNEFQIKSSRTTKGHQMFQARRKDGVGGMGRGRILSHHSVNLNLRAIIYQAPTVKRHHIHLKIFFGDCPDVNFNVQYCFVLVSYLKKNFRPLLHRHISLYP